MQKEEDIRKEAEEEFPYQHYNTIEENVSSREGIDLERRAYIKGRTKSLSSIQYKEEETGICLNCLGVGKYVRADNGESENCKVCCLYEEKDTVTEGKELVLNERQRQIDKEGWSFAHDDKYIKGELGKAAICYMHGNRKGKMWPWDAKYWKPSTELRNKVKAGALLLADKERIERLLLKIYQEIENISHE